METIISGSRRITDMSIIEAAIAASGFTITKVIEGGQRTYNDKREPIGGVDYLAQQWARRNRIPHKRVDAEWSVHGNAAGPFRNRQMALIGKQLIAIPDGDSRGTIDMIDAARQKDLHIYVHYDPKLFPEGPTGCLDDGDELSRALRSLVVTKL
jgi:hypothetical protein